MAKTLGSIIQIAGIAVLAYTTAGIGAGLVAGASLTGAVGATAAYLGVSSTLLLGGALVGLQTILGGGGSAPRAETTQTSIKTERPARVSAYGRMRRSGSYME